MKFWFDTEFYEDGKTIELISIGIVSHDGREYYAETPGAEFLSGSTDWLKENVRPHLKGKAHARTRIARDIVEFVGEKPEFWAYYADYDWVGLCQLYGRMIDLPKGWPMFCRDVKQLADMLGNPALPKQTTAEHHALADARWTRDAWAFCAACKPSAVSEAQVEAAAAALFCHAQFRGDDYTARTLARRMLDSAAQFPVN